MTIARDFEAPDGFATELMDALRLRTHMEPSLADVDRYVDALRQSVLESRPLWIEPWLPGEIGYRRSRDLYGHDSLVRASIA